MCNLRWSVVIRRMDQMSNGEESKALFQRILVPQRWHRSVGTMGGTSMAEVTSSTSAAPTAPRFSFSLMHNMCHGTIWPIHKPTSSQMMDLFFLVRAKGQGHPQVCHQEHCWSKCVLSMSLEPQGIHFNISFYPATPRSGRCCERHFWGKRLHQVLDIYNDYIILSKFEWPNDVKLLSFYRLLMTI